MFASVALRALHFASVDAAINGLSAQHLIARIPAIPAEVSAPPAPDGDQRSSLPVRRDFDMCASLAPLLAFARVVSPHAGKACWVGDDFTVTCEKCSQTSQFASSQEASIAWCHAKGKPWRCNTCTGALPAQETGAPLEPAQSTPWQYSRPKHNGGALQQHLDVFKGYTRYLQYPAKVVADVDWQAVVREVLLTQTHSWGAREVSEAALWWARSVCPDMTKSRLSQLQSLGAWTMDYYYTARRVRQNRAKAGIAFIPVPNASYYCIALASGMPQKLQELGLASNVEAVGNVFEVAAAAAFAAEDFTFLGRLLLELDKL